MTTKATLQQRRKTLRPSESFENQLLHMRNQSLRASLQDSSYNQRTTFVGNLAKVDYINDAGANNINATYYSLSNTYKAVIWIVDANEDADYSIIATHFSHRIKGIVCLGKCHHNLRAHFVQNVPIVEAENMLKATYAAQRLARPGQMVLFSPVNYSNTTAEDYSSAFQSAFNEL